MMKPILAALAFAFLAPASSDTLAFGPKEGTKLAKRFAHHMQLEKRSMTISMGGRELPAELTEKAVFDMEGRQEVEVVDEYQKLGDDRPLVLARTYSKLADAQTENIQMIGMPEPREKKVEKESKLEGKTVLFRWDEEKDEYAKEWKGDEEDDELLQGLKEDMDLRKLLPGKAVAEGDSWKLELKECKELLGPGGDFGFEEEGEEKDDNDGFEENLTGDVECTYAGTKDVDGRKLGRITITCKGSTFQEPDDEEASGKMTFEFDLEGEALWDIEGHHLVSYELAGDATMKLDMSREFEAGDKKHEMVIQIELGGRFEFEGEFTTP